MALEQGKGGNTSGIALYSMGLAAENLSDPSGRLEVTLIERHLMTSGAVTSNIEQHVTTGKTSSSKEYQTSIHTSRTVPAKWWPGDGNRIMPPDVRRGELLEIWRLGTTNEFYWKETGLNSATARRLETVAIGAVGVGTNERTPNPEDYYMLEISSQAKHILLSTAGSNGEAYIYQLMIDAEKRSISLTDNVGNSLEIESDKDRVSLINKQESILEILGPDICIKASGKLSIEVNEIIETSVSKKVMTQTEEVNASTRRINATTYHNGGVGLHGTLYEHPDYAGDPNGGTCVVDMNIHVKNHQLTVDKDIKSQRGDVLAWDSTGNDYVSLLAAWRASGP